MMTSKDLFDLADNLFQEGEGGYLISREHIQQVLVWAARRIDGLEIFYERYKEEP